MDSLVPSCTVWVVTTRTLAPYLLEKHKSKTQKSTLLLAAGSADRAAATAGRAGVLAADLEAPEVTQAAVEAERREQRTYENGTNK